MSHYLSNVKFARKDLVQKELGKTIIEVVKKKNKSTQIIV